MKVIISTPIKRHDDKKASSVVDDVIQQLQQLNTETIINEENMLSKKGLHLNRNSLDYIREICSKSSIDIHILLIQMLNLKFCHIVKTETKMEAAK